ncbi:hypothetical protein Gotri_014918 [Gossypium trilobum]|uniref:O-fucosyltransferase family protein n=1 Tax=Gossypium trilobum TaxID=34281 RepID=A0A7J9DZ38_9ROSI|nr:hypothetical protein [Gossypium trilobum]
MERFDNNLTNVYNFRIKAWSSIQYYKDVVLPKLLEEKIIRISPFANRLSFDAPPAVQRLRCLANYEALRFSSPILSLGETLVARMKELSANSGGKYVSVHLRFEEDMVAFSCCVFDGGEQEKEDMKKARERGWKGKFTKPGRVIRPGAIRINGKCPLTPLEVLLVALLLFTKVTSKWKSFKRQMLNMRSHSDSKGFELKRPSDSIYTFPCPDCMCHTNKSADSRSSSAT